jgi:putative transposase
MTGIIAKGEQDNVHPWAKLRAIDENTAHQMSRRIVDFAKEHGATILVFEHLAHFRPERGRYSRRANAKRSYWLRGRIFRYAKYKAWNEGIVTCRVSPKNTSRECAICGGLIARYNTGQPQKGYTPGAPLMYCERCNKQGHADRNASLVIGKRLITRYQPQEKPPTPLAIERPAKAGGVICFQDAERAGRLSTNPTRHEADNEQGTAQYTVSRMGETVSGIPRPLRHAASSGHAAHTQPADYTGVPQEAIQLRLL